MKYRRVLVTGGTGFIGRFASEGLANQDAQVVSVARKTPETRTDGVTFVQGDVSDRETFLRVVLSKKIDTIVHLASLGTTAVQNDPELGVRVNIIGMSNILEAARLAGIKVVFTSSIAVYGRIEADEKEGANEDADVNPVTVYGAGKLLCEKMGLAYAQNYGVHFVALRLTAVYGFTGLARRDVQYPTFSDHARRIIELPLSGKPVTVEKGGKQPCDFVYVKDVAQAIINACVIDEPKGTVFNIGAGEVRTLLEFADVIKNHNRDADVWVGEDPNPAYPFMGPVDISRARKDLHYMPTPFSECINDYIKLVEEMGTF